MGINTTAPRKLQTPHYQVQLWPPRASAAFAIHSSCTTTTFEACVLGGRELRARKEEGR